MPHLDEQTFRTLFHEQRQRTHRFLSRLTRSETEADDLLQETFLTLWRKRERFEGRGALEGFLRKTAYHVFLNHRERCRRRERLARNGMPVGMGNGVATEAGPAGSGELQPVAGAEPPAETPLERAESAGALRSALERALAQLPELPRQVFVLYRFEEMSIAEIAELTEAPRKTVETRLRRATQLLAEKLRPWMDER